MGAVQGTLNYLAEANEGQVKYTQQPERTTVAVDARTMPIHDMRGSAPSLEREGFMHARIPLDPGLPHDTTEIARAYNPLVTEFLRDLTGAPKIVLRPPILRWSRRMERADYARGPADYVHGDFSRRVFADMAADAVADDPDRDHWLAGRYAVIQTWRALTPPPQDFPLAVLDRRTVGPQDLVDLRTVIGGPGEEQAFWNFSLRHDPAHRWSYISDMTSDDVLVFIGSESDSEMPGILHSSFDNTPHVAGPVPRLSCELRAFVFWGAA